jgi:hypothetical protein
MARRERKRAPATGALRELAPERRDPDHHLWRNGRLWWVAFTVHEGHRQQRVRLSLGTDDVAVARARRDALFASLERARELRISLRFVPRRGVAEVREVA